MGFIEYFVGHKEQVFSLLIEHIWLTAISVGFAVLVGVPLGILVSYAKKLDKPILGAAILSRPFPAWPCLGLPFRFWV